MKKNKNNEINTFGSEENTEICTITDQVPSDGTCIAAFTFNDSNTLTTQTDNIKTPPSNGTTPPIDGESLDIKRTYLLRKSTVRKLNKLKSINPDLNIYVSSIVDMAIAHYYDYLTNNKK